MKSELAILEQISMRGRMAYALACLERLAAKFNFSSPKFVEFIGLLWEFTEAENYLKWNLKLTTAQWKQVREFGFWLINSENRPKPAYNSEPFLDVPEAVAGMMGLCAAIGEAHLYGEFISEDSECLLEKVLTILDEQGVQPPPMECFQKNNLNVSPDGRGFPAPRSYYMDI